MAFNRKQGYERYYRVAAYMYRECTNNINSEEANSIRENLRTAGVARSMGMIPGLQYASAFSTWYNQVRSGADWDHKPEIIRGCNLVGGDMHFPIFGDTTHEWFFDIWSNIHYGYVGASVGFSESTLLTGANAGEFFGAGGNDPVDDAMAKIGFRMWQRHGADIGEHQIASEVVSRKNWLLDVQESKTYVEARGSFRHIMPMSQGNSR
jgi:Bacterial toxin 44